MVGRNRVNEIVYHVLVSIGALIMVYPLLWMVLSSFKPTDMVLPTADRLIPTTWTLDNYTRGWKGFMGYSFGTFFANSFFISLVSTFGTLLSSAFVAYALQRLKFRMRKLLFVLVLSTMMLPAQILMSPQFMWYRHLNWVGTYYPMILPYFFAIQGFFVYLIMNFISGIPKSLDEAAKIDGAGKVKAFFHITMPMMKNVSFVCTILMFIWTINNFENIYLMTQGGPLDSTMILSILTYNSAFFRGQMGYASAINMVMLVFLTILSMIYLKALNQKA